MRAAAQAEVETWPPMTDEQVARVVVLCRPDEEAAA